MLTDATHQRKTFRRLVPLFFRKSRVVQAGEPLKVSEAQKQRNRWWFLCFRWLYWPFVLLLVCAGIVAFQFDYREMFFICLGLVNK